MGRRSDHSRTELRELIIAEGHRQMAAQGFSHFSARQVARAIGYSVGTVYNLFPSLDRLLLSINTRTFTLWTDFVRHRLDDACEDRIRVLVGAHFNFARRDTTPWKPIFDHRLPPSTTLPPDDQETPRD